MSGTTTSTRARARASRNSTKPQINVSDKTIKELVKVFKMMADEQRMKILLALAQHGEMHVGALCKLLGQSQPAVSHHLTLMRITEIIGFNRKGKENHYYLNSAKVQDMFELFFTDSGNSSQELQFKEFMLSYKSL